MKRMSICVWQMNGEPRGRQEQEHDHEEYIKRLARGAGLQVIETDLGEYIIQLAGEAPSHIIVPGYSQTKKQIAELSQHGSVFSQR